MLSRTASCLFWMARYMERAENLARLLDVSQQLALMPGADESVVAMPLDIIDLREQFMASGIATTDSSAPGINASCWLTSSRRAKFSARSM